MIYVTEGQLLIYGEDSDKTVIMDPHRFVLLRQGGAFRLSCKGEGYRGFGVSLRGEKPRAFRGAPVTGLADGTVRMLGGIILRHIAAPVAESREALAGLGQALVWEVLALERERDQRPGRDWAMAVRTALELNIGTSLPVREALASLPLSYRQLCRCFRERYGTSPKAYQELLRVDEARRMLEGTALDITSIATELGFSSSQHFAYQFRRMVGCTPSSYRREPRSIS
ncbi:MAG: helix-turn-helix transcriptional regulator [Lentisphaerae bacterium]|nr:helix-turn-helix transcriptional regulator [Lentisphaerota bacterium]